MLQVMNHGRSGARLTSHYDYTLSVRTRSIERLKVLKPYTENERSELRKIQQSLKNRMHNHLKKGRYSYHTSQNTANT
jgi:ribosome recycling factor